MDCIDIRLRDLLVRHDIERALPYVRFSRTDVVSGVILKQPIDKILE